MRKIAAFFTALAMFAVFVFEFTAFMDAYTARNIAENIRKNDNVEYSTWVDKRKDKSYDAIKANLRDDTVLLLGSSELTHGKGTKYHPASVFRQQRMNVMIAGSAYTQCLYHSILLGGIAPSLKSKRVVLILSPTWFKKNSIPPDAFAATFSESEYVAMLKNPNISGKTKKLIADRVSARLSMTDAEEQDIIQMYNRVYLERNASDDEKSAAEERIEEQSKKEKFSVVAAWKESGEKPLPESEKAKCQNRGKPDWKALGDDADKDFRSRSQNEFYMAEEKEYGKFCNMLKTSGAAKGLSYKHAEEYDDLRLFLDVCREEKIDVMLLLLPLNAYWYDARQFHGEDRDVIVTNIGVIAKEYGAEEANLFGESYTKGFFEDNVHPAAKGWVMIDEKIYDFFKKG